MFTPLSPSPFRIPITPDSPLSLPKSPILSKIQETYLPEGRSFKPVNLHPSALLEASNLRIKAAVQKQLNRGSADLIDSLARLEANRLEEGRAGLLVSPRPRLPTRSGMGSATGSDSGIIATSAAESSAASEVKKD